MNYPAGPIFPRAPGPFIRAARDSVEPVRELAVGQWALIPWFAKAAKLPYSTNNASGALVIVRSRESSRSRDSGKALTGVSGWSTEILN